MEPGTRITFTSDEPGVQVAMWSAERAQFEAQCSTPCELEIPPGSLRFEVGGEDLAITAPGTAQTWNYHNGSSWILGLSIPAVALGAPLAIAAFAVGASMPGTYNPPTQVVLLAAVGPALSILTGLGIWGLTVAELPSLELVSEDDEPIPADSALDGLSLLPSLAAYPMENGRTAYGISLTLAF